MGDPPPPAVPGADNTDFAHESERDFARLLDFYDLAWEYEPRRFPVEWGTDGRPRKFFTPDFYLPDEDLFIEITTMNQKLVTSKNRKVRRLRELHPEVRIKVLYQKDYLHLAAKYGLSEGRQRAADLTREPGPPRVRSAEGLLSPAT